MKQSTKLLSLLLALVMIFGVMTIGVQGATLKNSVVTKTNVNYDSIDNAALTPGQVATIICDLLDGLLLDANIAMDVVVANIDLTSLDNAFSSLYSTLGNILLSNALVGDVNSIKGNRSYFYNGSKAYARADGANGAGDLVMLRQFVGFLTQGNAPDTLSKLAYGIGNGDNSLSIGLIGNFVSVDMLNDIPGMLKELVFDALLHGSYSYPNKYADAGTTASSMTLDGMLNTALYNLLTTPQDYEVVNDEKVWDMDSIISKQFAAMDSATAKGLINVNSQSILAILDNIIQIAYDEFAPTVLNNDVKKLLMEATGVDFVRIKDAAKIAAATADPDYIDVTSAADVSSVKNYLCNAQMWKVGSIWYFRDYVTQDVLDASGNPTFDESGEKITAKADRFFYADMSNTNAFFDLVNWDWFFTPGDYNFAEAKTTYGSIFGQLNHLLSFVLNKCINPEALTVNSVWVDGDNTNVNENLMATAKWVILNFTKDIFGKDSEYVENGVATQDFINSVNAQSTLVDLVAYIGLPFMNDAMPQLIIPDNLESGKQIVQLGAVIIREFMTDICPDVNYDSQIFQAGTLTAATGRKVVAGQDMSYWTDLILNMGIDIGYTYLDQVTNFNMSVAEANAKGWGWEEKFEEVVDWGVAYIDGILNITVGSTVTKLTAANMGAVRGEYNGNAFEIIDKVLNSLLPLGFVTGVSGTVNGNTYDLEIGAVLNKLLNIIPNLDIEDLLSLFGRNTATSFNLLSSYDVVESVLRVLQKVLNNVLPGAVANTYTQGNNATLTNFTSQAGLKVLIKDLLVSLGTYVYAGGGTNGLLYSKILPLVATFISDWSGEQEIGTPEMQINNTLVATDGNLASTGYTVMNGSKGIWRHGYLQDGTEYQDNQYKYKLVSASATNVDGTPSSYVTGLSVTTAAIDFGQTGTLTFALSNVPAAGAAAYINLNYKVIDEDNAEMAGGKTFTVSKLIYLSRQTNDGVVARAVDGSENSSYVDYYPDYYFTSLDAMKSKMTQTNDDGDMVSMPVYHGYKANSGFSSRTVKVTVTTSAKGVSCADMNEKNILKIDNTNYYSLNEATFDSNNALGTTLSFTLACVAAVDQQKTVTSHIHLIDETGRSELEDAVASEGNNARKASDYYTADRYATKVLTTVDDGETIRESNFTATTVVDGEEVTVINGETAWSNYIAALNTAVHAAYQVWNTSSIYDFTTYYNNLKVAISDLEYCKKSAEQLAAEGAENIDTAVAAIKADLATIETQMAGKNYTDYKLYRWDRFKSWKDKANDLVNLQKNQSLATADESFFPYYGIGIADLTALLGADQYAAYILATAKAYTADEIVAKNNELANLKTRYSQYTGLDVDQIGNMLSRTSQRLLYRFENADHTEAYHTDYIDAEIASAVNTFGSAATQTVYTAKSWNRYLDALSVAQAAAVGTSQSKMFDAKYELQCARNELVLIADEADYTELEALIEQAQYVFANASKYDNSAADFGALLAELGYHEFTNADGDEIQLFPGSALLVDAIGYSTDDQRKIDNAANELKAALAKMKFIGVQTVAPVENVVLDEEKPEETTAITTLPKETVKTAVKDILGITATGTTTITVEVSDDNNYALSTTATYAGTGATVTVYNETAGVKIPVATYKIVVNGDVNGDSVVDAFDVMVVELTAQEVASLSGLFYQAGNLATAEAEINSNDYSAVVNVALSK